MYHKSSEAAFQSIHIPFAAFTKVNSAFDASHVKRIRLIFDRTPARVIILSAIGEEN
jgi:hypothetical protein